MNRNNNNFYELFRQEREEEKVYSVSEFIDFINNLLTPTRAVIQGEINQIKLMDNYAFFTLVDKNEEAALNCFIWQNKLNNLGAELKDGSEIKVEGYPNIFKRNGRFTFEVDHISLVGEGALKQAFETLKKELAKEGYFEPERKKKLPKYVKQLGLITSVYGDAKNDFLTHLGNFGFKVTFCDVRVEGLYAIDEITLAIRWFNENMGDLEALVLTRGGGSLESLQPYNSKEIAKAIFASKIPIITAIGHENNETIADLVADVYASTPTDAARILSDPWRQAHNLLDAYEKNITSVLKGEYTNTEERLNLLESNLVLAVDRSISFNRRLVNDQQNAFSKETGRWLRTFYVYLDNLEQKLKLSDPTRRLRQGYSIIFNSGNKVIKSSRQIAVHEEIFLKFYEGEAVSRIEKKKI